jgi:hypothetical protein
MWSTGAFIMSNNSFRKQGQHAKEENRSLPSRERHAHAMMLFFLHARTNRMRRGWRISKCALAQPQFNVEINHNEEITAESFFCLKMLFLAQS